MRNRPRVRTPRVGGRRASGEGARARPTRTRLDPDRGSGRVAGGSGVDRGSGASGVRARVRTTGGRSGRVPRAARSVRDGLGHGHRSGTKRSRGDEPTISPKSCLFVPDAIFFLLRDIKINYNAYYEGYEHERLGRLISNGRVRKNRNPLLGRLGKRCSGIVFKPTLLCLGWHYVGGITFQQP